MWFIKWSDNPVLSASEAQIVDGKCSTSIFADWEDENICGMWAGQCCNGFEQVMECRRIVLVVISRFDRPRFWRDLLDGEWILEKLLFGSEVCFLVKQKKWENLHPIQFFNFRIGLDGRTRLSPFKKWLITNGVVRILKKAQYIVYILTTSRNGIGKTVQTRINCAYGPVLAVEEISDIYVGVLVS